MAKPPGNVTASPPKPPAPTAKANPPAAAKPTNSGPKTALTPANSPPGGNRTSVPAPNGNSAPKSNLGDIKAKTDFEVQQARQNAANNGPTEKALPGNTPPKPGTLTPEKKSPAGTTAPRVVVVDHDAKNQDVDGDGPKDTSHMELVKSQIKARLPEATIETKSRSDSKANPKTVGDAFDELADEIAGGKKVDAVNLSQGDLLHIDHLKNLTGDQSITPANLAEKRVEIRQKLMNMANDEALFNKTAPDYREGFFNREDLQATMKNVQSIEKVTAQKVPVFVAAGNTTADEVNMFLLANGTTGVTATDANGKPLEGQPINSLAPNRAQGAFRVVPVQDSATGNVQGVDITGDNQVDIPASQLSGNGTVTRKGPIRGSSLATPVFLADTLRQQFNLPPLSP